MCAQVWVHLCLEEGRRASLQQRYNLKLQAVMYHQMPASNRGLLGLFWDMDSYVWCNTVHNLWILRAVEQYITIINHWLAASFSWCRWSAPRFHFKVFPWCHFHFEANITAKRFIRCRKMTVILKAFISLNVILFLLHGTSLIAWWSGHANKKNLILRMFHLPY